ncbi:MAG: TetR/AcrR family transcriptional regulator [Actinobacteria bacterium]|nr:TetR/AcrR family transcriptional regulator [Actinomycetota bacterium]
MPRADTVESSGEKPLEPRERVLATAYDLFSHYGIRAVGVDRIIEQSGVAKMTFYRNFRSKEQLVLAFLRRREQLWTVEWLEAGANERASDPVGKVLAIFDLFDSWFANEDFEGCSFINVLLEMGRGGDVGQASTDHLANIRSFVRELVAEAGVRDPDQTSRQIHMLMKGSIIAAAEGDRQAARRAREVAELLLERELVAQSLP